MLAFVRDDIKDYQLKLYCDITAVLDSDAVIVVDISKRNWGNVIIAMISNMIEPSN